MLEPVLQIEGLDVRYGEVGAVRGLNLEVAEGEIVGLIGPNGAGKSTTLMSVMGVVGAAAGDVKLRGKSLRRRRTEDIVRSGVALVPEGRHIFHDLTVEENLELGLTGRRSRKREKEDLEWVRELFPVVSEHAKRSAGALSGGQQQQLAIARALVSDPDLLMLDEPSLGLSPTFAEAVFATLETIRSRGVTVLVVEQRAHATIALADRTYVLANGEMKGTLTTDNAQESEWMIAAYLGS